MAGFLHGCVQEHENHSRPLATLPFTYSKISNTAYKGVFKPYCEDPTIINGCSGSLELSKLNPKLRYSPITFNRKP